MKSSTHTLNTMSPTITPSPLLLMPPRSELSFHAWRIREFGEPHSAVHFFFFYIYGDHRDLHSFPTRRSSDLQLAAVDGVERDQPAVERADEDLALVQRDAAVDDVAARLLAVARRDLGVERPQLLAGARVDRVDHAPRRGDVHDAVDDQRRGLDAALGLEVVGPRQPELLDVLAVDPVELAEP